MPSLSSSFKIGTGSATSLIKSAASLSSQLATYQDTIQKFAFQNDPSDGQYQEYVNYLQGRIKTLDSSASVSNQTKAAQLNNEITTAYKTNTTFNIDQITTQMLIGGASDQNKLDFLTQSVLTNPLVQGSPDLYTKYMNQAYSLQKSIEYQAQVQQNAATTLATANAAAQKQGFTTAEDQLNSQWNQIKGMYESGDMKGFNEAAKVYGDTLKSAGVNLPSGAGTDYQIMNFGQYLAKIGLYENIAQAAGASTATGQDYTAKATALVHSADFYQLAANAMAPSNLFSPSVGAGGKVAPVENAISGYTVQQMDTPFGKITINVPQTTGNAQTTYQAMVNATPGSKNNFDTKLANTLGLSRTKDASGNVEYTVSDKTPQWFLDQGNIVVGERLTLIPTAKGFQFSTGAGGSSYGVSFDSKGLPALYKQGAGNIWTMLGSVKGYSQKSPQSLQSAITQPPPPVQQFINNAFHSPGKPSMVQRAGGGFNFTNAQGQAISAATYAMLTHQNFYGLLQNMAQRGDAGAKQGLSFIGGDMHYDPTKIAAGSNASTYNALTWGAEPNAKVNVPGSIAPAGAGIKLPSGIKL